MKNTCQGENVGSLSTTQAEPEQVNLLPPPELALRVSQSEFAKIMDVTRACVSKWVRDGKIKPGADGRFCPRHAAKSLLASTDPNKLRARVLKDAAADAQALRDDVARLYAEAEEHQRQMGAANKRIRFLEREVEESNRQLELLPKMILEAWPRMADMTNLERGEELAVLIDDALTGR